MGDLAQDCLVCRADADICNNMLPYVNQARAAAGVSPPLKCATEMGWAAQYHTNDMVSMGHLTHDGGCVILH